MVSLSLLLALMLLNSSLLISASGGRYRDGHGYHDGHGFHDHDGHGFHNGHGHGFHDHDGHGFHDGHGHGFHDHDGHGFHGGHGHGGHDDGCRRSTDTETVCEDHVMQLSCPGRKIKILNANYGRTDSSTCITNRPPGQILNTNCHSSFSLSVVSGSCDGHESCSVPATNGEFSDPCFGTYKFLTVKYCCRYRWS
ncbi:uncharacterized protein LOC130216180 [Danio aesculapii]|uniref:uncharacterized protein LOC130216180 n=1 Tax=Danio aesculapii TaxID=1142201 RepID=UPI0024BF6083|nr:uncharacterized protein LOC130216180 [Danio aesculapii]